MSAQELDHARKGFTVANDTVSHSGLNSYGFTVLEAAALTNITLTQDHGYMSAAKIAIAEPALEGLTTFPVGFYPIRCTEVQLASGSAIFWEI